MDKEEIISKIELRKMEGCRLLECGVIDRNIKLQQEIVEKNNYIQQLETKVKELEEKNKHLSSVSDYETISLQCVHLEEQLDIANERIKELEIDNYEANCRINDLLDKDEHTKSLENKVKVLGKQVAELIEEKDKLEIKVKELEEQKQEVIKYANRIIDYEEDEKKHSKLFREIFLIKEGLTTHYQISRIANNILCLYDKGENKCK